MERRIELLDKVIAKIMQEPAEFKWCKGSRTTHLQKTDETFHRELPRMLQWRELGYEGYRKIDPRDGITIYREFLQIREEYQEEKYGLRHETILREDTIPLEYGLIMRVGVTPVTLYFGMKDGEEAEEKIADLFEWARDHSETPVKEPGRRDTEYRAMEDRTYETIKEWLEDKV